jgi:hypothetical protein
MKTKSKSKLQQINNSINTTVSIPTEHFNVTVRAIYPYDYPDFNYFKRKEKREQRLKKLSGLFPDFKENV